MGYCNVHLSTKFNASTTNHLTNDAKHNLRQHLDPKKVKNVDSSRSHLNLVVVDKFGLADDKTKTLWKETKKYINDNDIYVRNKTTVLTGKAIFGMPRGKHSDEDIAKWVDTTKNFLNEYEAFKDNVTLAVLHRDEKQVHIEVFFIPQTKDNKLNYGHFFGGNIKEGTKKLKNLHDEYFLHYRKLGYKKGDGKNTNNLTKKQYQASMSYIAKTDLEVKKDDVIVDDVNFFNKSKVIEQQQEKIEILQYNNKVLSLKARTGYFYKEKYSNALFRSNKYKTAFDNSTNEIEVLENEVSKKDKELSRFKKASDSNFTQLQNENNELKKKNTSLRRELDILQNPEFEEAKKKLDDRLKQEKEEQTKKEEQNKIKNTNDLKYTPK
jgi:hypothetical protein